MTREALNALLEALGLDGTPLEIDLPAYHVPYDDRGRGGIESGIRAGAARGERLGVIGPIGAGKTTAMRFSLDDPSGTLAPIWVSVARDGDEVIGDPRAFMTHVIQHAVRHAEKAATVDARLREEVLAAATDRRPLPATARRVAGKVGAKFWLANAELAADVTRSVGGADLRRPLSELRDSADLILETIGAHGLQPVLVIDDSDAFTRHGDPVRHARLVEAFFGPVLAEVAKLRCGLVVAVHERYLELEEFQRVRRDYGALQRNIEIPEIVSGQLRRILARRAELSCRAEIGDVCSDAAIEALAEINRGPARRNLRTVLTIAHEALVAAVNDDRDLLDAEDISAAASKHLS